MRSSEGQNGAARTDVLTFRGALRIAGVTAIALTAANCAQQQQVAGGGGGSRVDPRYGVAPSPRVVADGQAVPKGGGRALVGKPYVIAGKTYVPYENSRYARDGLASWYGAEFHGRMTANGEVFDKDSLAAAHPTMPLPSYARITNLQNRSSMIVRVNDRGPYHNNRLIDVSQGVAEALDFKRAGTARVRVEYVGRAGLAGSDDRILMASLRTDGMPAAMPGGPTPTMIAQATPRPAPEALAFREPVEQAPPVRQAAVVTAEAPARQTPMVVAEAPGSAGRLVRNVVLPPERPFDLATIPQAASRVRPAGIVQAALPPARPVLAGLYYAPVRPAERDLEPGDPFRALRPQTVISLKSGLQ